ncbi:hypothetical protein QTP88_013221 [Uroleucon formosanum]
MVRSITICPIYEKYVDHQGIKQTLYEAMFGTKAQRGLLTFSFSRKQIEKLSTEDELEQILQSITLQTDSENKGIDENEVEEESNGKSNDNLDNQANIDEDKLSDKSDDKNQNKLLNINEKKENTIKNRALALNGLQTQASVILRSSNQKFPPAILFERPFQISIEDVWITKISWLL